MLFTMTKLKRAIMGNSAAIDSQIQKQITTERDKMIGLLKRFLDVTICLGSSGLPFRGTQKK